MGTENASLEHTCKDENDFGNAKPGIDTNEFAYEKPCGDGITPKYATSQTNNSDAPPNHASPNADKSNSDQADDCGDGVSPNRKKSNTTRTESKHAVLCNVIDVLE